MEDNNVINSDDFFAAFSDDDGYQTDTDDAAAETEDAETTGEETNEPQDGGEDGSDSGEENEQAPGEEGADDGSEGDKPAVEENFTIKVNKEERTVGRKEMISLAQKGADYDRVKDQLAQSRQTNQGLREQLGKYKGAIDMLDMLSAASGTGIDDLVEQIHTNWLMQQGKSESEAKAEIRATKAEKRIADMEAAETAKQKPAAEDFKARAEREVAEFHSRFPDVKLTEELCNELVADVQKGMTLADAYQKKENARKDAEITELRQKLAASEQNKRNRAASPGSQNDTGGRRAKSDFDEFMAAFE